MKKINLFLSLAIAAIIFAACGNKEYDIQKVTLNSQNDSLNYAVGVLYGQRIKMMNFPNDSSNTPIAEFISALDEAYNSKEVASESEMLGIQLGAYFKKQTSTGVSEIKSWKYDHELMCQGLINGINGYTGSLDFNAQEYVQKKYSEAMMQQQPEEIATSKISGKCPTTVSDDIKLATEIDSINYAIGYVNGMMINDQFGGEISIDDFVNSFNKTVKENSQYPTLKAEAKNFARVFKTSDGLLNDPQLEFNYNLVRSGLINGAHGDLTIWDPANTQAYIQQYFETRQKSEAETQKAEGEEFLKNNAQREGVKTTASGLQYEVLEKGTGKVHPKETSTVKVHYHGTLIDGTVFDSSVERGEPTTFPLNGVIKGWTEGVQLMVVGDKFRFFIPYELAYGERSMGDKIKPCSTLIFDVELLEIEPEK